MTHKSFANIFDAVEEGTVDDVRYFVENEDADVNAKGFSCGTLLHIAVATNTLEVIQYLVAQGADVNAKHWRDTPLHKAAEKNSLEVVQYLISQGADVNAKGYQGQTPLHYAAGGNSVEVVQYLVSQGADALAKGSLGRTPLHNAAESNTLEVLQYLISQGADVDAETGGGDTPLLIAIGKNSNMSVVEYLFKCSDVNVKDAWDSTALHKAAGHENRGDEWGIPIMQNLILRGADVNAKNINGKTPLDRASSDEKKRILREAGAIPGKITEPQAQSMADTPKDIRREHMKFTDFILIDAIVPEIKATDKLGVIREMVQSLVYAGGIEKNEYERIAKAIFRREELGSTSIGRGIALPHIKDLRVKRHVGGVAISAAGIDFDSFDDEKSQIFFMVISPMDYPGSHIRILEHLTRRLKDDTFRLFLTQCKTREAILALLEEADRNP
jgi:PTS system fructose-specific IIA component/PTS system nitrogen regulatory IIA component